MADDDRSEPILTETHVIIIACVCGVIIVTLLVILFCFIFRRRRNAAKTYENGAPSGDPPPYTSVSASHKKPHQNSNSGGGGAITSHPVGGEGVRGYDNQGMDTSDLQLNQLSVPNSPHYNNNHHPQHPQHGHLLPPLSSSSSPRRSGGLHVASSSGPSSPNLGVPTNSSYGPLELHHQMPSAPPQDEDIVYLGQRSPRRHQADVDKHLYENQLNQWSENNRMDGYPNREGQSPTKDKYIDLQDRGGGDMLDYGGGDPNSQPSGGGSGGGGKPKKVIYEVVV